jgi:serine/threonine-protein kinase
MGVTAAVPVVSDPKAARKAAAAAAPVGRKSRKRVGIAIGALLAVAAIVVGALYVPILLRPQHTVPDLTDNAATLDDVRNEIAPLKFKLSSSEAYSEAVEAGQIISQSPHKGSKLREQSTVKVVVSKGPPPVDIPPVVTKPEAQARLLLEGAGFIVDEQVDRVFDETIEKGIVMKTTPDSAQAPKGSVITLTVSDGPQPRTISDWTNKPYADAKAGIEAAGLKVNKVTGYSDTVAVGNVISTNPKAGGTAERGSTVTVTVCAGSETVAVPSLSGMTVPQARAALQAEGLAVGGVFGPNGNNRHVFFTSPGAGVKVKRGSAVNLYVQ